jgi:hypothetical protein
MTAGSPLAARPTTSAFGKCTEVLKTTVPDEIAAEAAAAARSGGYGSVSDWLREVVIVNLRGENFLIDLHRSRIKKLSQNSSTTETEGAQ